VTNPDSTVRCVPLAEGQAAANEAGTRPIAEVQGMVIHSGELLRKHLRDPACSAAKQIRLANCPNPEWRQAQVSFRHRSLRDRHLVKASSTSCTF
jgi:hypothetical protein